MIRTQKQHDLTALKDLKTSLFKNLSSTIIVFLAFCISILQAQIDNDGCVGGGFGIDADVYSDQLQFGNYDGANPIGTYDWFTHPNGGTQGTIDESAAATIQALLQSGGNPFYQARMNGGLSSIVNGQIMIDAVWSREYFGGTGFRDLTAYETASKNGEDPAIWDGGVMNVLGKNDLLDVAGHMRRDGQTLNDDLWFYGTIVRAEPGGTAYMDFEFYIEEVGYDQATETFDSGGPDIGHTAFKFDAGGNIIATGDIIFNVALVNGGIEPQVEMRIWVSRDDYDNLTPAGAFSWGAEYDGAFNGSPFGYALIVPNNANNACGNVNKEGEHPSTPPWGSQGTKTNTYITNYDDFSVVEIGANMTAFGIDNSTILGADPCDFPFSTFIVKTRASASFTAQLKDFAGPYAWGQPSVQNNIVGDPLLSCLNPEVTLTADPARVDVTYLWTTIDGRISSDPSSNSITVNRPGTYTLNVTLPTGCPVPPVDVTVGFDPTKPFFNTPTFTTEVSCNGSDGSVDINVTGATAPYTYLWTNGATTEDIDGLAAGDYTVTITDNIGCTIEATATVEPRVPTVLSSMITHIDCHSYQTGAIDLSVTGQSPFTYFWSNGATSQDLINLFAGAYTVTVTDADGCTEITTITVTQPSPIALLCVVVDESDAALNDGSIDITVSGGTTPYSYDWDNDGPDEPDDDTEDLTGLSAGTYTVTVTDANGCMITDTKTIYEPEICNDGIDNDGDGLSDCSDSDCTPETPGTITPNNPAPCAGDAGVTYSIDAVPSVSVYQWTVPEGAVITAGQGTTSITVTWTGTGGQICVQSDNVGCLSTASCLVVSLNDVPTAPGAIIISN